VLAVVVPIALRLLRRGLWSRDRRPDPTP
jgi:hypothetical protein